MPNKIPYPKFQGETLHILGLNSGTSADGLDMALARFSEGKKPIVLDCRTFRYPEKLRARIIAAGEPEFRDGIEWLRLDCDLGELMGRLARKFLDETAKKGHRADLIGSHGQTVRHLPAARGGSLTLQIGDPAIIAAEASLPVVADFRRSDLAAGGEGAPLSPILHQALFSNPEKWQAVVNIGGISNATVLPPTKSRRAPFAGDCGPGNMPIDLAMRELLGKPYDRNGKTASKGNVSEKAVRNALRMAYFAKHPPKSTGRELFGRRFLERMMKDLSGYPPADIVATASEITVGAISDFMGRFAPKTSDVYLCGGGTANGYLVSRLKALMPQTSIGSTADLGYDPDYLEAVLWAYLAYRFVTNDPVSCRNFTGAVKPYIPGKLCLP